MKTANRISVAIVALIVLLNFSSCDKYNYTDQLQGLGTRVEKLEKKTYDINTDLEALKEIISNVEKRGFITSVVHNDDGTWTLTFSNKKSITIRDGNNGQDGQDGQDGNEIAFLIGVDKGQDGQWYWTLNGEWILDDKGNKMPVTGADGEDGKDGQDGKNGQDGKDGQDGKNGQDGKDGRDGRDGQNNPLSPAIVPQVRINEETRQWEISTDGGNTWNSTGISADGKNGKDGQDGKDGKNGQDGKDGKNGQNGKDGKDGKDGINGQDGKDGKDGKNGTNGSDDIFIDVVEAEDGSSITFVLADGRTFTVPIIK